MDTILFFTTSSARGGAQKQFVSAQMTAESRGFHLQMVERTPVAPVVRELARLWRPMGAIVDCGGPWGDLDPGVFGWLPVVVLGHNPETLPPGSLSVRHDSAETGRTAARELLATGFRNFAYVPTLQRRYWSMTRQRSFVETIRLHGFDCLVMESPGATPEDPVWQRRVRPFLRSLPKPCAIFAATDIYASEILAAARYCGIDVPGELAVLGVDNNEAMCERSVPTLSSIEPDFARAGRLAVEALLEAVALPEGRKGREWIYGDLRVVRRESTRPLASHDAVAAKALALIRHKAYSLSYVKDRTSDGDTFYRLTGTDRCGIVDPWAQDAIKRADKNLSGQALLGRKVSTGGTVEEHRIYFAVDKDGDGFVDRAEGAPVTTVRAKAITWCAGADGGLGDCTSTASMKASLNGRMITNADNVYSWQRGQEAR